MKELSISIKLELMWWDEMDTSSVRIVRRGEDPTVPGEEIQVLDDCIFNGETLTSTTELL